MNRLQKGRGGEEGKEEGKPMQRVHKFILEVASIRLFFFLSAIMLKNPDNPFSHSRDWRNLCRETGTILPYHTPTQKHLACLRVDLFLLLVCNVNNSV